MDIDLAANRLIYELSKVIDAHNQSLEGHSYGDVLTSQLLALYALTGKLRHLCEVADDIKPEVFDQVFINGLFQHYEINREEFLETN